MLCAKLCFTFLGMMILLKRANIAELFRNKLQDNETKKYIVYGAAVTEAEVDILTGQYQILRADVLEDAGESLSPEIDVGQVEGGFVMGLGYFLTERILLDRDTGVTITNNTWNYWPPGVKDIPIDFRVTLLKNSSNPFGVLRSKATGEPPICLALSAVHAITSAVHASRTANGQNEWFDIKHPCSIESTCLAAETKLNHLSLL